MKSKDHLQGIVTLCFKFLFNAFLTGPCSSFEGCLGERMKHKTRIDTSKQSMQTNSHVSTNFTDQIHLVYFYFKCNHTICTVD